MTDTPQMPAKITAWGDFGPGSVTGQWSANTYAPDIPVATYIREDQPSPSAIKTTEPPKDGSMLCLLLDYREGENPLEDALQAWTIGHNTLDDTGEDEWVILGWNWEQDCYTQGTGKIIGWMPFPFEQIPPNAMQRFDMEMMSKQIQESNEALTHLCQAHGAPADCLPMQWLDTQLTDLRAARDRAETDRAEQWRLRRDAAASRDVAKAACDSMRIERDSTQFQVADLTARLDESRRRVLQLDGSNIALQASKAAEAKEARKWFDAAQRWRQELSELEAKIARNGGST